MARALLSIFVFLSFAGATSAWAQTVAVKSLAELAKLGISVERLNNDTPMASVQIGCLVEVRQWVGEYDHTECVVLSDVADGDRLEQADAGAVEGVTIVRRSESTKERSIFLVLGRDLPKAYLAFHFNAREGGAAKPARYLFPISKIRPRRE